MGLVLQISLGTSCRRSHWGPLPYLGQWAAALLCLGPLQQKMGVQGGCCTGKNQLDIGSLAQEGLRFQGAVGDGPCPLCRGGPWPPYPGDADGSRAIFNPLIAELTWMGVLGVGRAALLLQLQCPS